MADRLALRSCISAGQLLQYGSEFSKMKLSTSGGRDYEMYPFSSQCTDVV